MRPDFLSALAAALAVALVSGIGHAGMLNADEMRAWRGVGRVNIGGIDTHSLCTGTLVAPDLVLTAAHCIVERKSGKVAPLGSIHFVAGWYKGEMTGHSTAAAVAVHPFYQPGIPESLTMGSDVALIRLRDPLKPDEAKPLRTAPAPEPGAPILVLSYRRDRPHALTRQDDCTYRERKGPVLVLGCSASSGASGAPIFARIEDQWRQIGVMVAVASRPSGPLAYAVAAWAAERNLRPLLKDAMRAEAP